MRPKPTRGYADAQVQNNLRAAKEIGKKLKMIEKYGAANRYLLNMLEKEEERMQELREKYLEIKIEAEENLPNIFLVNPAVRPEIKAYPKRGMVVIISTFVSFIFALVFILFWDRYKGFILQSRK